MTAGARVTWAAALDTSFPRSIAQPHLTRGGLVGGTRLRRPPAPADAERARSLATRGGTATLVGTGSPAPAAPLVHHVRADGSAVLLLADDEPLLERVRTGRAAVMLELADRAPVDLREPVRGLL